jgi:hypothetical protein
MARAHLIAVTLVLGCSSPAAPSPAASVPTRTPVPSAPAPVSAPSTASPLEAALFALVAHPLSPDVREVSTDVASYVAGIAMELGVSEELRTSGRLTEARTLREHAHMRALTLQRLEALRTTTPSSWSMVTDPPGGWLAMPPEEAGRVADVVDRLSERAFADIAPVDAPDIDAVVVAVERYTTPLDDEGL